MALAPVPCRRRCVILRGMYAHEHRFRQWWSDPLQLGPPRATESVRAWMRRHARFLALKTVQALRLLALQGWSKNTEHKVHECNRLRRRSTVLPP